MLRSIDPLLIRSTIGSTFLFLETRKNIYLLIFEIGLLDLSRSIKRYYTGSKLVDRVLQQNEENVELTIEISNTSNTAVEDVNCLLPS